MTRIKTILLFFSLIFSGVFTNCSDDKGTPNPESSPDYFVFGSFYGECMGEMCVEVFVISNGKLYENTKDQYPPQGVVSTSLVELGEEKYQLVKDLPDAIPSELFNEAETIIGCPDCADGGGIYIETIIDGEKKYWLIDNSESLTPEYLHPFIKAVNEKVVLLR